MIMKYLDIINVIGCVINFKNLCLSVFLQNDTQSGT